MNKTNKYLLAPVMLLTVTALSGTILMSSTVNADNDSVVDEINITVPVSCTLSGTGMNSHNANIVNGTYQADIGTTTLKAFCNDSNGFAIYAAGYTGNEIEGTNSNKLVGTSASSNAVIDTGLATSTGSPDVSNWAMKLETNSSATYALTLDNGYGAYSLVPNSYTKVAHRDSGTDIGASATGAELTTTYAAYISKTQPADSYTGQVIYTLVHPTGATPSIIIPPTSCPTPVPGLTYMQDLTSSNKTTALSSMTEDAEYYLADKRDDKTYCVAKLRDGNLWMTQNLDHDIVTDGSVTYDNTTTDLGWNGTNYSIASWTPASATKTTSDTTWITGSAGYTIPESYDPGELYWNGVTNSSGISQTSTTGNSHYHIGNYYNWTAAIAMNDSSNYTSSGTDANQSICPAGWTLPKSNNNTSNGSFHYLFTQYGWSNYRMTNPSIWDTAIKLPLSGRWNGSLNYIGNYGDFKSLSVGGSQYSFTGFADANNSVHSDALTYRYSGSSVRCLAR